MGKFLLPVLFICIGTSNCSVSIDFDITNYGIKCELEWIDYGIGSVILPEMVKVSAERETFVARHFLLGSEVVGVMEDGTGTFFSKQMGGAVRPSRFQVLANPGNCFTSWTHVKNAQPRGYFFNFTETLVSTGNSTKSFIGRYEQSSPSLPSSFKTCSTTNFHKCEGETITKATSFQVLQSVHQKLSYNFRNVTVKEDVINMNQVVSSFSKLLNKGDAEVSTSKSKSSSTSNSTGKENSRQTSVGGSAGRGGISGNAGLTTTRGDSESTENSDSFDDTLDIMVPPQTSVEICWGQTQVEMGIRAEGEVEFFLLGIEGNIIQEILKREGFKGPFHLKGGTVSTLLNQQIHQVKLNAAGTLKITPADAYGFESCTASAETHNDNIKQDLEKTLEEMEGGNSGVPMKDVIDNAFASYAVTD